MITTLRHSAGLPDDRAPAFLSDRVRGAVVAAFFAVHRELGQGFSSAVYRRALATELSSRGFSLEHDVTASIYYKGAKVGSHRVPLVVEGKLVVEVVASERVESSDLESLLQLVRAAGLPGAVLLHFGRQAAFRHVEQGTGPTARVSPA